MTPDPVQSSPPRPRLLLLWGLVALLLGGLLGGVLVLALDGDGFNPLALEFREIDQHNGDQDTASWATATRLGQSFRAGRANLDQVALQLTSFPQLVALPPDSRFVLRAGTSPTERVVVTLPLAAADFRANPYLTFSFPAQADSAGQLYTFEVETPGQPIAAAFTVALAGLDSYSAGSALADGVPQPGDLAFRTTYRYTPLDLAADVARALRDEGGFALALAALLWLPGLALLGIAGGGLGVGGNGPRPGLSLGQQLLAAPAVTLLAWPVALGVARVVGLPISSGLVWAGLLLTGGIVAGLALLARRRAQKAGAPPRAVRPIAWDDALFWLALVLVFGLTLVSRLATIRDLVAGMGLDGYHHTMVAALFLGQNGLPTNYEPYAPLTSFTYHYGFHAAVAAAAWLRGGMADSTVGLMPLVGQVISALPVLTFTLFGWRVLGRRWLGLGAGGLAGLVAIFPAFYVNWSRYPQLLGVALLPVAWVLVLEALAPLLLARAGRSPERSWLVWSRAALRSYGPPVVLAVLTTAGLFLTHYRLFAMFATYLVGYLGWVGLGGLQRARGAGDGRASPAWPLAAGVVLALGAGGLVLPWLLNLRANFTVRFAGSSAPSNAGYYDLLGMLGLTNNGGAIHGPLVDYWSTWGLLVLAVAGLVWAGARLDWPLVLLGLWLGLHLLLGNPTLLPLPGSGYVDITTVVQSAFLPVCFLAAYLLSDLAGGIGRGVLKWATRRQSQPNLGPLLALGGVTFALVIGAYGGLRALPVLDVKPYVAPQDRAVLGWLQANSPPDARVLGNGFGWRWGPLAVQGSDAGLWVPLLGHRAGTVPPIPAYNERLADPGYLQQSVRLVQASADAALDRPANWATLRAAGVTYIYIGSRGGALDPALLLAHPEQVRLAYHLDDAWLFALLP